MEMLNQDQPSTKDQCGRFWNGLELLKDATEKKHLLPTGIEGIDTLLGGGLRRGQLTEVTGPSSSGKTQVCMHSASLVAAKHLGVVMYLDTGNSFSPGRIATIIDGTPNVFGQKAKGCEVKDAMRSIICESVFDIFALFEALNQLEISLLNDKVSMMEVFHMISDFTSNIFITWHMLNRKTMVVAKFACLSLTRYHPYLPPLLEASIHKVTNHMVSAGNGAVKPALGESWKAVPHVRLVISRECGSNICTATVLKHTVLASGSTVKFVVPS